MIIDFRVRPPYKSFLKMRHFNSLSPAADFAFENMLSRGRKYVPSAMQKSMDIFLREMDEAGISKACICGRVNDKIKNAPPTDNNDIHELCNKYPDRFIPFAAIDPLQENAMTEIQRTVRDLGFKGINMDLGNCGEKGIYVDDPLLEPIYCLCAELQAICVIGVSALIGSDMSYSDPVHIQRAATRHPDVPFVIVHACWPYVHQATALASVCQNVYLSPDFYVSVPDMPGAQEYVSAANSFAQRKTLYASSYPFRGLKQSVDEWCRHDWNENVLADTLYYNAARLLKL